MLTIDGPDNNFNVRLMDVRTLDEIAKVKRGVVGSCVERYPRITEAEPLNGNWKAQWVFTPQHGGYSFHNCLILRASDPQTRRIINEGNNNYYMNHGLTLAQAQAITSMPFLKCKYTIGPYVEKALKDPEITAFLLRNFDRYDSAITMPEWSDDYSHIFGDELPPLSAMNLTSVSIVLRTVKNMSNNQEAIIPHEEIRAALNDREHLLEHRDIQVQTEYLEYKNDLTEINILIGEEPGELELSQVRCRKFKGIDYPLFRWPSSSKMLNISKQRLTKTTDGRLKPDFRLQLSTNNMACFTISGNDATPELHAFLKGMFTNWMGDERYKIHQEAGAFFQGGSDRPDGQFFLIEFWKPSGAQAFIDYINAHYKP